MTLLNRRFGAGVASAVVALAALAWREAPRASQFITPQIQDGSAVRALPVDAQTNPGRRGTTFYALESRITRVTSRYHDGTIVVGERGADGVLHVKVTDSGGGELARLEVGDTLRYSPATGDRFHALIHPDVRPTLEWGNRQAYALLKEGVSGLRWQGGVMRAGGVTVQPRSMETEWPGGLTVRTSRRENVKDPSADGRVFTGAAVSARLARGGLEIGAADWYPKARVFRWTIPTLRVAGSIEEKHLERYGGWPFEPDPEWLNVQLLAFYHFKTIIDEKGFVASNVKGCAPRPSLAARLFSRLSPTLYANEDGCDSLHWLDGSVLRYCCDIHDRCYAKYGCNSTSWWQIWSSWRCDACNVTAIWCFASGGCLFMGGLSCP